jgi:beta-galactosidase GanA
VFNDPRFDFVKFLQLAHSMDLLVIARIGPYITAEVDFGGFPYWIQNVPDIQVRRPNPAYYSVVQPWIEALMAKLAPLQYQLGGPIIDFQIEVRRNETEGGGHR